MSKKITAPVADSLLGLGTLIAAAPSSDASAPRMFTMELYSAGYVFMGHWKWGNIVLDLAGLQQHRQDVPALENHWRDAVAGFSKSVAAVAGGKIVAEGQILNGTKEDEPVAYKIRTRLEQGFPYQCSGRFEPVVAAIESVPEGKRVTVDGFEHVGPISIFRKYTLAEVSFTELGWYTQSKAKLAAGENADSESHAILISTNEPLTAASTKIGESIMPGTNDAPKGLLSLLADAFGAKDAIAVFEKNPTATGIEAFAPQLVETITALRASVDTLTAAAVEKDAKITTLEADLKAARANPPLKTAEADPSTPAGKPAAKLEGVEALKAEYAGSADLQAEFGSVEAFLKFKEQESHISIT